MWYWAVWLLLFFVTHIIPEGIFFFFQITLFKSQRLPGSLHQSSHRLSECSACRRFNCHITSASAAVVLNPVLKPLISVSVHSDCWLTKLRLQASKLFPLPSHILLHIPFLSRFVSLKISGFLRVWLKSDLMALCSGLRSQSLTPKKYYLFVNIKHTVRDMIQFLKHLKLHEMSTQSFSKAYSRTKKGQRGSTVFPHPYSILTKSLFAQD